MQPLCKPSWRTAVNGKTLHLMVIHSVSSPVFTTRPFYVFSVSISFAMASPGRVTSENIKPPRTTPIACVVCVCVCECEYMHAIARYPRKQKRSYQICKWYAIVPEPPSPMLLKVLERENWPFRTVRQTRVYIAFSYWTLVRVPAQWQSGGFGAQSPPPPCLPPSQRQQWKEISISPPFAKSG